MSEAETRARLLKAAAALFAERGFKKVTVREICGVAEANVAAVNYHFGDKLGLYREVLQGAIDAMRATTDAAREAGTGRPAEEQLRQFIKVFLQRLLAPGHQGLQQLIHRELHDPTPALDTIVEQALRPRIDYLAGIVGRMIGRDPSDEGVMRSVASIQAQSFSYMSNPLVPAHREVAARLGFSFQPTSAGIEAVADHIAAFSIAGVYAVGGSLAAAGKNRRR